MHVCMLYVTLIVSSYLSVILLCVFLLPKNDFLVIVELEYQIDPSIVRKGLTGRFFLFARLRFEPSTLHHAEARRCGSATTSASATQVFSTICQEWFYDFEPCACYF